MRYSCRYGYNLVGSEVSTCEYERDRAGNIIVHGGLFMPLRPTCDIVTCPDPGMPLYGSRVGPNGTLIFGTVISFYCPTGYTRVGPSEVFCQGNGEFSAMAPTCESQYGILTLVRFRTFFLTRYPEMDSSEFAFLEADTDGDRLLSRDEFALQGASLGMAEEDVREMFDPIQWRPDFAEPLDLLVPYHYNVLRPTVNTTEHRVLMASIYTSAQFMFEDADTNLDERTSTEDCAPCLSQTCLMRLPNILP